MKESQRLNQVDRYWMLLAAHRMAKRSELSGVPLWSFVGSVCGVGSTSATQICKELGWDPCIRADKEIPLHTNTP